MALYAIGDLHLSFSVDKPMEVFGDRWKGHIDRLRASLSELHEDDVLVLAGDTSWGIDLDEALDDFAFVDAFPGKKILLKGNHDYWWGTAGKMKRFFAEHDILTLDILHNNCFTYGDYAICGTRGWFYEEDHGGHNEKMLLREAQRLTASFEAGKGKKLLCFLHYPPIYMNYRCPEILEVIDKYAPEFCYYGHLHGPSLSYAFEGKRENTTYSLISADALQFVPKKILE